MSSTSALADAALADGAINKAAAASFRKRRLSYTRVACDECQRRKTKCTGEQPCKVCRNSNNVCQYKRTTRFRSSDRGSHHSMTGASSAGPSSATSMPKKAVRSSLTQPPASSERPPAPRSDGAVAASTAPAPAPAPAPAQAPISSPTSPSAATPSSAGKVPGSEYYLRLAEKILVTTEPHKHDASSPETNRPMAGTLILQKLLQYRNPASPGSVLALIDTERWLGIMSAYDDEIGLQYPFLDIDQLCQDIQHASQRRPHNAQHTSQPSREADGFDRERVEDVAMLVLTIVSFLVDSDVPSVADDWVEKTYAGILMRTQLGFDADPTDVSALILVCIYYFLTDREIRSWRGIGIALRLLVEKNTETAGTSRHSRPLDPVQADKMFWTVFTLDRRWSFGTGLPFAVHDTEVDRRPILTEDSPSSAYLKNMISYCSIASDVRKWLLESSSSLKLSFDATRDLLIFRIDEWQHNLPAGLQFKGAEDMYRPGEEKRGTYRIRLMLHLRANQLKIIIHRRSAVRSGSNSFDSSTTNTLAKTTHDTIRILVRLAQESDIYQTQHKTFNHFLDNALSSLLLVLGAISDEANRAMSMQDAYDALDLIQRLSMRSTISQRLRDKYHGIREAMNVFNERYRKPSLQPGATAAVVTDGSNSKSNSLVTSGRAGPSSVGVFPSGHMMEMASLSSDRQLTAQAPIVSASSLPPVTMPVPMGLAGGVAVGGPERGNREQQQQQQQEMSSFPAYGQSSEELCPGLTPDTFASTGTYPHMYTQTAENTPNTSQAFGIANGMLGAANDFTTAATYFPEFGHMLNFCENNFSF